MKISIILPCYNMEKYIEETLLSIINQKYKNLELIVVDGGSTDKTLSILSKYSKYISLLISEKDEGQYFAINKGMSKATGDIMAWLNADDVYLPWTLKRVSAFFTNYPEQSWISGSTIAMNEKGVLNGIAGNIMVKPTNYIKKGWFRPEIYGCLQQEGMFWRRELWEHTGGLNVKYRLASDFELWTRFCLRAEMVSFGLPLASFRHREDSRSKSMQKEYNLEIDKICKTIPKSFTIKLFFGKIYFLNKMMKKITFAKGMIYYYSPRRKKWILNKKTTSLATFTLSDILFLK